MSQDEMIQALREALELAPGNSVIRNQLGRQLMQQRRWEEALRLYQEGLKAAPASEQLQLGLAECYRQVGNASAALVILEELIKRPACPPAVLMQYARLLLGQGQKPEAARAYRRAVEHDASLADAELARVLGVKAENSAPGWSDPDGEEQELLRLSHEGAEEEFSFSELEKPNINFAQVGGMEEIKEQIRLKIIEPLRHPEIYRAYGKSVGGSILLYGPPGCGKTHLARATAGEVSASFLAVGLHDILDMYIGNSEQRLHALFEQARNNTPCVLFFDEVDALGASRADMRHSAGRHLINQFLAELDGIAANNEGILILAATNAPWHLDPAFRRPGRFDRLVFVPPPDSAARAAILQVLLRGKPVQELDLDSLAKKTGKFSGADLKALVDQAIEDKLRVAFAAGAPSPLTTKDLLAATKSIKPSTLPWFASARNYALYANEGGIYDDVLRFLDMK